MIIDIDMNNPDYLSSLCLGEPFDFINTIEEELRTEFYITETFDY